MQRDFLSLLRSRAPELALRLRRSEMLASHCSMQVGGPADYYLSVHSGEELALVLALCQEQELNYFVLGKGSNVVFSDKGYRGLVVHCAAPEEPETACRIHSRAETQAYLSRAPEAARTWSQEHGEGLRLVSAQAGLDLVQLSRIVAAEGLEGLAFACGIPGSVGGAIYMNAGAYEGCMQDVCLRVAALDAAGQEQELWVPNFAFGYRDSCFRHHPLYIREVQFLLRETQDQQALDAHIADLTQRRERNQPLELPSAGSVFKRPVGHFAGKLIIEAGLQGLQQGGAQVSLKHAGFIVNRGGATAQDIIVLVCHIRQEVLRQTGVQLEPEIRLLHEDGRALDWERL